MKKDSYFLLDPIEQERFYTNKTERRIKFKTSNSIKNSEIKSIGDIISSIFRPNTDNVIFIDSRQGEGNTWFLEELARSCTSHSNRHFKKIRIIPFRSDSPSGTNDIFLNTIFNFFGFLKKFQTRKRYPTFKSILIISLLLVLTFILFLLLFWSKSNLGLSFISLFDKTSTNPKQLLIIIIVTLSGVFLPMAVKWIFNYIRTEGNSKRRSLNEEEINYLKDGGNYKMVIDQLISSENRVNILIFDNAEWLDDNSYDIIKHILGINGNQRDKFSLIFLFRTDLPDSKNIKFRLGDKTKKYSNRIQFSEYSLEKMSLSEKREIAAGLKISEDYVHEFSTIKEIIKNEHNDLYFSIKKSLTSLIQENDSKLFNAKFLIRLIGLGGNRSQIESFTVSQIYKILANKEFYLDYCSFFFDKELDLISLEKLFKKILKELRSENLEILRVKDSTKIEFKSQVRTIIIDVFKDQNEQKENAINNVIHLFWIEYYLNQFRLLENINIHCNSIYYQLEQILSNPNLDFRKFLDILPANRERWFLNKLIVVFDCLVPIAIESANHDLFNALVKHFCGLVSMLPVDLKHDILKNGIFQGIIKHSWDYFFLTGSLDNINELNALTPNQEIDIYLRETSESSKVFLIYKDFITGNDPAEIRNRLNLINHSNLRDIRSKDLYNYVKLLLKIRLSEGFIENCSISLLDIKHIPGPQHNQKSIFNLYLQILIIEIYLNSFFLEQKKDHAYNFIISVRNYLHHLSDEIYSSEALNVIYKTYTNYFYARTLNLIMDFRKYISNEEDEENGKTYFENIKQKFQYEFSTQPTITELFPIKKDLFKSKEASINSEIKRLYNDSKFCLQLFNFSTGLIECLYYYGKYQSSNSKPELDQFRKWWEIWYKDYFLQSLDLQKQKGLSICTSDIYLNIFNTFIANKGIHESSLKNDILDLTDCIRKLKFPVKIIYKYLVIQFRIFNDYYNEDSPEESKVLIDSLVLLTEIIEKHEDLIPDSYYSFNNPNIDKISWYNFLGQAYFRNNQLQEANDVLIKAKSLIATLPNKYPFTLHLIELRLLNTLLLNTLKLSSDPNSVNKIMENYIRMLEDNSITSHVRFIDFILFIVNHYNNDELLIKKCIELVIKNTNRYIKIAISFNHVIHDFVNILWKYKSTQNNFPDYSFNQIISLVNVVRHFSIEYSSPAINISFYNYLIDLDLDINNFQKEILRNEMERWLAIKAEGEFKTSLDLLYKSQEYENIFNNYLDFFCQYISPITDQLIDDIIEEFEKSNFKVCISKINPFIHSLDQDLVVYPNNRNHDDIDISLNLTYIKSLIYLKKSYEELDCEDEVNKTISMTNNWYKLNIPILLKAILPKVQDSNLRAIISKFIMLHENSPL